MGKTPRLTILFAFLMLAAALVLWWQRPLDRRRIPARSAAIRIDINVADAETFALLPGVGRQLGARIVEYRRLEGPFEDVDQLLAVTGIGAKTLARIRPLVVCGPEGGEGKREERRDSQNPASFFWGWNERTAFHRNHDVVMINCVMDRSRARRILRQHVLTDQLLGVEAVPLGKAPDSPKSGSVPVQPEAPIDSSLAKVPRVAGPALDRGERIRQLEELDINEVRGCTRCELCRSRTQTVFGEGDPEARILFIGEGPGQNEDTQGRPFVGRSGDLLNKQIAAMGLQREQVFIGNVVKCRPPNNRAPTAIEVEACSGYLRRQIQIIGPEVIITLGGPAAKLVLNTTEGITRIRGGWFNYDGLLPDGPVIPVMPTFHPAYLLRAYTTDNRKKVWSDLQQVMQRLGL